MARHFRIFTLVAAQQVHSAEPKFATRVLEVRKETAGSGRDRDVESAVKLGRPYKSFQCLRARRQVARPVRSLPLVSATKGGVAAESNSCAS